MVSSAGRARPNRYFSGSVNRTVTTLNVTHNQEDYQHKPIYNPMRTSMNNDTKKTSRGRRCLPKSSAGKRTIHSSGRFRRILRFISHYLRLPVQLSADFLVNGRDFMKKSANSSFLGGVASPHSRRSVLRSWYRICQVGSELSEAKKVRIATDLTLHLQSTELAL